MLEKTHTPAALLLGAMAGVLAATLCILGSAAWMAKQGCSASMGVAAGHGVGLRRGLLRQRTGGVLEKRTGSFDGLAVGRTVCGSAERSAADVRRPV